MWARSDRVSLLDGTSNSKLRLREYESRKGLLILLTADVNVLEKGLQCARGALADVVCGLLHAQ